MHPAKTTLLLLSFALLLSAIPQAQAQTETLLYSFAPAPDGASPVANLVMDSNGNLYGTTEGGGTSRLGTVFEISSTGTETVLYNFKGNPADGAAPKGGLVMDSNANLYGTTSADGSHGAGTVFKLSAGTETVLYNFKAGKDGGVPDGGVILDSQGNLYGTTAKGGAYGHGTAFELTPGGTKTILHSFGNGSDGSEPEAGLVRDSNGNLYGTTVLGGSQSLGTVFEISSGGTESVLHSFTGESDGAYPSAALILDGSGDLYGTAAGESAGESTVFKVASGTETVLASFPGTTGGESFASLVLDGSGNLYGTNKLGGANNVGSVFEVSPGGTVTILHSFVKSKRDGYEPLAGLVRDSNGNLYGTTFRGGSHANGTVFKVAP